MELLPPIETSPTAPELRQSWAWIDTFLEPGFEYRWFSKTNAESFAGAWEAHQLSLELGYPQQLPAQIDLARTALTTDLTEHLVAVAKERWDYAQARRYTLGSMPALDGGIVQQVKYIGGYHDWYERPGTQQNYWYHWTGRPNPTVLWNYCEAKSFPRSMPARVLRIIKDIQGQGIRGYQLRVAEPIPGNLLVYQETPSYSRASSIGAGAYKDPILCILFDNQCAELAFWL